MSRILVTGRYINRGTYELVREDGSVFQTIKAGEPFKTGRQLNWWVPELVPRKSGKGTIMMCRKYSIRKEVLEEFPLLHNKKGLWATSAGAARNGVFHTYHEPKSALEKRLRELEVGMSVVKRVSSIDETLTLGGVLCSHCLHHDGYRVFGDGEIEQLTEPDYAPDDHFNPGHRGCMESTYTARLYGGTWLVYYHIVTAMNGSDAYYVEGVWLTPEANEEEVLKALHI